MELGSDLQLNIINNRIPDLTPARRSLGEGGDKDPGSFLFNGKPANTMHVDLNSCFATIEQQANPALRGLPVAVAAYPTNGGCIVAPSIEAKKLGVKVGMRVGDGKKICPELKILTPDPPKYRCVHQRMMKIFESYTPTVEPKSIDEAVLVFKPNQIPDLTPARRSLGEGGDKDPARLRRQGSFLFAIGKEIKRRIRTEIGEWLTVSIGLSTNRFLAKTAASLKKPDGLEEINGQNLRQQFSRLKLEDLCGINVAYKARLNSVGIFTTIEFLNSDLLTLKAAFRSINAHHWYFRLRGFEVDSVKFERKSIGHSYALPKATNNLEKLSLILYRLSEKVGRRLRGSGLEAKGVCLHLALKDGRSLGRRHKIKQPIYASSDVFGRSHELLREILSPPVSSKLARVLSVSVFSLSPSLFREQPLFEDEIRKIFLTKALDRINDQYGEFTITLAPLVPLKKKILDRVAFGKPELPHP